MQVLYCLSPAPSPFCSCYFGNGVSLFAQAGLNYGPPVLFYAPSLSHTHVTTIEMGSHELFARAGLELPDLSLPSS
jgi:hypothetical protein